jgi:hypothetical protein
MAPDGCIEWPYRPAGVPAPVSLVLPLVTKMPTRAEMQAAPGAAR